MEVVPRSPAEKTEAIPPCQVACPIHQDVPGYLAAIAQGNFGEALRLIKDTNPLPSICATICAHPCEAECRRGQVDEALSIRALKRAAVDFGCSPTPPAPAPRGERVAIIGSGPAGLTAAHDLARLGYQVTVFEREAILGGALAQFVPLYRLPRDRIQGDIEGIRALGVEFRTDSALGRDFTVAELKGRGYRAVLLGLGLPLSRSLPLPGFDMKDVWPALPFLRDANLYGRRIQPGKTVIVIGGGNVAIDVARSALRAGAARVRLVCLESPEEMPAFPWEIKEAAEEGVEINCSWGPKRILGEDGQVTSLETVAVKAVFDDQGRFNPTFYEDRTAIFEGDIVIVAIGQAADLSCLKDSDIQVTERGQLIFDPVTLATTAEGVFTCGEVATGPGTAVKAMASGRQAALSIHRYLQGEPLTKVEEPQPLGKLDQGVTAAVIRQERQPVPLLEVAQRIRNFDYIDLGYAVETAVREARRCLSCGAGARRVEDKCIDCLTCVRVCPYEVPVVTPATSVDIRADQCQACGICVMECPARAIAFGSSRFEDMERELEQAMAKVTPGGATPPRLVLFYCYYGVNAPPGLADFLKANITPGVALVKVPCLAKLGVPYLLKAFELGANGVLIVDCGDRECIYAQAALWVRRRMESARRVLEGLGLRKEQIELVCLPEERFQDLGERMSSFSQRLGELVH
ncbi:MAG TPA: FAD-dependent oxidoreductase [Dehalococcoidia bacterium]|nr:FAD-dependent oxidoreductase [Dehalococcoidia bacterium]